MLAQTQASGRWSRGLRGLFAVVILLAGVGFSSTAAAEDLKIGYVDLHEALNEIPEGKEAKKRLRQDYKAKQEKLNQKQKEVKKLKEELQSQSMALSDEAKRKKQKQLQKKMQELQQTYMELQRDLSKKEAKETKDIFEKMRSIVKEIAEEKNYDLVLEKSKSSVLYGKEKMDLTGELIERLKKD